MLIPSVTSTGSARGENGDLGWQDVDPDQGAGSVSRERRADVRDLGKEASTDHGVACSMMTQ